jgi:acetyl-CoA carboxylase biotin carboxylase subunit
VGGIKTNISLFRRILLDKDFRAGKLDTGFLDRLLADGPAEAAGSEEHAKIAAVAAGLFAALDPGARVNGAAASESARPQEAASAWKRAGLAEATKRIGNL